MTYTLLFSEEFGEDIRNLDVTTKNHSNCETLVKNLAAFDQFILRQHRVPWALIKKDLPRLMKTRIQ